MRSKTAASLVGATLTAATLTGILGPANSAFAQAPPAAVAVEAELDEAALPEGQPAAISDWALAGVVWSDAHLVRRLAQAAAEASDSSEYRERMALLANDCDELINSLETFGWRRIAVERAEQRIAAETPVERAEVVVPDPAPDARLAPAEAALSDEVLDEPRPFSFRRYRVSDYIAEGPLGPLTPAEAAEEGVEEAVAAAPDKADAGFEQFDGVGPDARRQAQTQSATLPYAINSIYDVGDVHPNATYPERPDAVAAGLSTDVPRVTSLRPAGEPVVPPNVPTEELLDEVDSAPLVRETAAIDISRYTDRVERFRQDANWVKFRLAANQQRWQMLQDLGDDESAPALDDHLDAALLQLQADAATALAASKDSQLAEVLQDIVD